MFEVLYVISTPVDCPFNGCYNGAAVVVAVTAWHHAVEVIEKVINELAIGFLPTQSVRRGSELNFWLIMRHCQKESLMRDDLANTNNNWSHFS